MKWYALNKEYVNYLKQFDNIVPDIQYSGKLKCFLGIILKSDDIEYFAPLTSYKFKFEKLKNDIDFFKIIGKNNKIYGAIAINNMLPVPLNERTELTLKNLSNFREFKNFREQKSYWKLLQKEMLYVDEEFLLNSAKKLFEFVTQNPNSKLSKRCCNFSLLKEKCKEYEYLKNLKKYLPNLDKP